MLSMAYRRSRPRPAIIRRLRGCAGFTVIEAVIGLALFVLVLSVILLVYASGWKTDIKAFGDSEVQYIARGTMNRIVNGDPSPLPPGLIEARTVVTDPSQSALAYRVFWHEDLVEHDQVVTYYLSGGKLYRSIAVYPGGTLSIVIGGGTQVADHVEAFTVSANGVIPVELTLTIKVRTGSAMTLKTAVKPRELDTGP